MAESARRDDLRLEDLPDSAVNDEMDGELRTLLASCFDGPASEAFLTRRFFLEPPEHRFLLRAPRESVAAHAACRWRPVGCALGGLTLAGVSEVCVHPAHRGQGLVRRLLDPLHARVYEQGGLFVLLFGRARIYASSGYRRVDNVFRYWDASRFRWREERVPSALVRPLSDTAWPEGPIDLKGILF
ncbi:MAG: GNAT family N-acetyltransferase [Planctomycetota bacterium]|nr:GNAT family N-acetyltransferase [Planctomycetota bacterium]